MTALDPSKKPPNREYVSPNTDMLIKIPIPNGEIHHVKDIPCEFPEFTTSGYNPNLGLMSSNSDESKFSS